MKTSILADVLRRPVLCVLCPFKYRVNVELASINSSKLNMHVILRGLMTVGLMSCGLRTPIQFFGENRYEGVWFNVISVTRGWVVVQIPGKKRYVTLEWPLR